MNNTSLLERARRTMQTVSTQTLPIEATALSAGAKRIRGPAAPGLLQMVRQRHDVYKFSARNERRFGPVHAVNMFGMPWVCVGGVEASREVLLNRDEAFANCEGWGVLIGPFFHGGLMLMDFDRHSVNRRLLQSAFTRERLQAYSRLMLSTFMASGNRWTSTSNGSPHILAYKVLKQLTLDLALDVFLGVHLSQAKSAEVNTAFVNVVRASGAMVRVPVPGTTWSRGIQARRYLEEFIGQEVGARKKRSDLGDDLLSGLVAGRGELTNSEIVDHMIFLLMASHDTTTTTMATMLWATGQFDEWQQALRVELEQLEADDVIGLRKPTPVFDAIFRESARLFPPVPIQPRRAVKDAVVAGFFVPKGQQVFVPTNINHRDPAVYPDPEKFDPGRFLRGEVSASHPGWAPFGAGAHHCIGSQLAQIEARCFFWWFAREYDWSTQPGYEYAVDVGAIPRPRDGLPLRIFRREHR